MVFTAGITPTQADIHRRWGWFVALGILMIIAGIIALVSVFMATVVAVTWVGAMMVVSGIFEVIHGFQMKSWSRFFLWIVIGALYVVAGFIAFMNPILASTVLTLLLGFGLIFAGVLRIFLAMQMRAGSTWGWIAFSGVITLILGLIIVLHWPVSSLYTLGIFLGVDLVIVGASWLSVGLGFRRIV
jgi:uncharacterized membrane protein HdeD (DUF308 family)